MEEEFYEEKIFNFFEDENNVISLPLSYSRISDYDRNGPKALDKKSKVENKGVRIGSITDDLLFNRDNFEDLYLIFNGTKPTATLGKLTDIILENYAELPSKEEVLQIVKNNDFWSRSKDETILGYLTQEFWGYLKIMFEAKDKQIITTDEYALAEELVFELKTHKHSKHFFDNNFVEINQFPFSYEYNDCLIRGVMDKIIIDEQNKTIQFLDLKTGIGSADEFISSFIKYRYYFQAGLYQNATNAISAISDNGFFNNLHLNEFTLLPFKFVYISRKEKIPFVFSVSDKWINAAFNGYTTSSGYKYKGINELLEEIKWHWHNKVFNMNKEVFLNNGEVFIDDSFIKINE